jgi:hypothetical protein
MYVIFDRIKGTHQHLTMLSIVHSEEAESRETRKRARALLEDEEEFFFAFMCYNDHVLRAQAACTVAMGACSSIVEGYVKYRGGMQEVRCFEIPPDIRFQPDMVCEKAFVHEFRFTHAQFNRVVLALLLAGVPSVIRTQARDSCPLYEALAMLCMKYSWPTRLGSMVTMFGCSTSRISRIVGQLRRHIFNIFSASMRMPLQLEQDDLFRFSAAVELRCGQPNIFGFIDGTVRPISKPSFLQGACYNGKDRVHSLKWQGLTTPDGMLRQLCGPYPGSRHDMHLLHKSELLSYINSLPRAPDGGMYSVYADQGYAACAGIETPFFDGAVNAVHEAYNQAMASARICVEWSFAEILCHWASLDMKRMQQLLSNRKIGQVYLVAGVLTNFKNCMQPNKTSTYFGVSPPCLEQYVQALKI